ncbi:MAG: hypothetical protein R2777_03160 [Chitinophagales bacterium]
MSRYANKCEVLNNIDEVYYKIVKLYPNPATNALSLINLPIMNIQFGYTAI